MSDELKHYGMPRRSGRYPWGSGDNPYQRSKSYRAHIQALRNQGLSDVEIARGEGINTTQLRARLSIAKDEVRAHEAAQALRLYEKGYSKMEIGRRMDLNESSVRALLNPALSEKAAITKTTANMLKEQADQKMFIDIGPGVENYLGISRTKLNTAVALAEAEGYKVHKVNVPQLGMPGQFTTIRVLGAPTTEWKDIVRPIDVDKIKSIVAYSEDRGRSYRSDLGLKPIQSMASSRIKVHYIEDGGGDKDGVIEIRRGVKDLDLGNSRYAQVRIAVDDTHYMKGMAMYSDKMPPGHRREFTTLP
jgi:biotin operon repressor